MTMKREALMWEKRDQDAVRCNLCPNYCMLKPGKIGKCGARKNEKGVLTTLVYGGLSAMTPDPIEKKPFFNYWPGSGAFSISSVGCTLHCKNCQNFHISQKIAENFQLEEVTAEEVVEGAIKAQCRSIAYTYNEPLTFYEFIIDCSKLAHSKGLLTLLVTNGYITLKALEPLIPSIDAANVDIKGMTDKFYKEICGVPHVKPILDAIKYMKDHGIHIEITNLVIPGYNDSTEDFRVLAEWVLKELGPDAPLHFSRFHPLYELSHLQPTPVETLIEARKVARDIGLHYVYCGNVPGESGENTYCPKCGNMVVGRMGFSINKWDLDEKKQCKKCGTPIAIIGEYTPSKNWGFFL